MGKEGSQRQGYAERTNEFTFIYFFSHYLLVKTQYLTNCSKTLSVPLFNLQKYELVSQLLLNNSFLQSRKRNSRGRC